MFVYIGNHEVWQKLNQKSVENAEWKNVQLVLKM